MQSTIMSSTLSGSCRCGSRSIKSAGASSSVVCPEDGSASFAVLDVRHHRGKLTNPIVLRAEKKSFSERSGRRCHHGKILVVKAERADGGRGGSLDEKLDELNSEKAVEGMQGFDRTARLMVDNLKPVEHPGTTSPQDLELQAEEKAFKIDESLGGKEPVLEVASDTAVDPEHAHEDTVVTSEELAPELGLSVEDLITALEDRAEEASDRDAELLSSDRGTPEWEGGVGQVVYVSKESGVTGEEDREKESESKKAEPGEWTREEVSEKVLDAAREGFEVLKWVAEGVISAGANSREGFEVAKEIIDKRLKSFNIAAEETKEVSAQLSEAAKKKYEELQSSATKFGEELNVQIEDKKAGDELKPDSEKNLLSQLNQGVQSTIDVATKEDSPLSKLGQSLQEAVSNLGKSGQEGPSGTSSKATEEQSKEESDRLVPVGDKEGFFQDLAPANGSSPQAEDRSKEASDILGQSDVAEEEQILAGNVSEGQEDQQEFEGFFGDIPVNRSASGSSSELGVRSRGASDTVGQSDVAEKEQTLSSGNASASEGQKDEQKLDGFFGDIPVNRSASSSAADTQQSSTRREDMAATSNISGDASATMRRDYEDEVGNEQLKETQKSGGETAGSDAGREHDPAPVQPSVKGKDDMGIGPDE